MCARRKGHPCCYACGLSPARYLSVQAQTDVAIPVFCSLRCAAWTALAAVDLRGIYWCRSCWDWHTREQPCSDTRPYTLTQGSEQ
jgi:hypothetical protein